MNNIILTGRLTKDPSIRYIPGTGTPVASFVLAVDREYTKKDGSRDTDFIPIEVIGKSAEFCAKYLSKGRLVAVQGSIRVDRWVDKKTGEYKTFTKVAAKNIQALDKRTSNASSKSEKEKEIDRKLWELASGDIPF